MYGKIVILLCLVVAATAQISSPGRCDETVQVVQDFDVAAYTGLWYEVYRYEQFQQLGGDCVTAEYTLQEDGVGVVNKMVLLSVGFNITGIAIVDPSANPGEGKLLVTFPSVGQTSPYWVLATNYDSYALVYLCDNIANERKRISTWILSRTKYLKPQDILEINEVIEKVDGLDWPTYRYTNQTESACRTR